MYVNIPVTDMNEGPFQEAEIKSDPDSLKLNSSAQVEAAKLLESAALDLEIDQPAPQNCIEVVQAGVNCSVSTLGNFTLIIGKAKSRKTFFITFLLASALMNGNLLGIFKGSLPKQQPVILSFDTEQGLYHVQKAARRVLKLAGVTYSSNFRAFSLRKHSPADRLKIIEYAIYNTPNLGLVVIDGIRDLIASINDEEQSTMLISKLLKWTEEKNIHIVTVLHQNKGDNNARGHLGSEAVNKAETVISIAKDSQNKAFSIVDVDYSREIDFTPFAFEIDSDGLPQLAVDWKPEKEKAGKPKATHPGESNNHFKILSAAFKTESKLKYKELLIQIKLALAAIGTPISDNAAKEYIQFYMNEKLLMQHGTPGTRHSYYSLPDTG